MENKNIKLTQTVHDYFSRNQFDKCVELAAETVQITAYAFGMTFNGRDEFRAFMQGFKQAFPDMVIEHNNILGDGSQVAVEFTAKGTHTGPLQTPAGEIPASGKKVALNVIEVYEWDNDRFTKMANYQDSASLMRQIGAL
jgi:steroid delta-isomerase-like uncharacterized protein